MSKNKQCPNGHYYDSAVYDCCPYCPKDYASVTEVDAMANSKWAVYKYDGSIPFNTTKLQRIE